MATLTYYPTEEHASRFWKTQQGIESEHKPTSCVPDGFPKQLRSSLAWTRAEIEGQRSKWIVELDKVDIEAIEAALASFEGSQHHRPIHLSEITDLAKPNLSIFRQSRPITLSYQRRFPSASKKSRTNVIMGSASILFTGSIRRAIRPSKTSLFMQGLPPISLLSTALWIVLFKES